MKSFVSIQSDVYIKRVLSVWDEKSPNMIFTCFNFNFDYLIEKCKGML